MNQKLFLNIRQLETHGVGKQKIFAKYVLSHFDEIGFKNLADLANDAAVSESTIIRFARTMGFRGFPELRTEFQEMILEKIKPSQELNKVANNGTQNNFRQVVDKVFEIEIGNLKETQEKLKSGDVEKVARCIIGSKRKYVTGLRASSGCAYLLGYLLNHIVPDVCTIMVGGETLLENLRNIEKDDILIAISFPRYTKSIVDALLFAKAKKATTVTITDSVLSPPAQVAQIVLDVPVQSLTFSNSYTACLCLINSLVAILMGLDKENTKKRLVEYKKTLKDIEFFMTEKYLEHH
jgi:DNA-binding MurR/RpiR family transcriptional regulator